MESHCYKTRKGLDLKLQGEAGETLRELAKSEEYGIKPTDFTGIVSRLVVKPGDEVKVGTPLFVDKATERVCVVSPVSGVVSAVERGERRKLLCVRVKSDGQQAELDFSALTNAPKIKADSTAVLELLLKSGLFAFMRQRPYDVVASPNDQPRDIFVSTFSKMPLSCNYSFAGKGEEADFRRGLKGLAVLAPVHVGLCRELMNENWLPLEGVETNYFCGPNPLGNVGVQINHVRPVNKGEVVWTMDAQSVAAFGRLLRTGRVDFTRVIAVAGSEIVNPSYCRLIWGTPLKDVLSGQLRRQEHVRIINGNPLVGTRSSLDDYFSAFVSEICAIPEGDNVNEAFGWAMPRLADFSTSRTYFSWLQGKKHPYNLDCRIKGGERHMIMSGEYDRVFPMDIYANYLVKAIITGDIDRQEALGIYEVAPEDFAVAEFVDSSKLELQRIVREGLDLLRKENS